MSITTSGSGESQREAHKARRTLVWHSILFTARRLGFAYTFWRARGGLLEHVEGVQCISRGCFIICSQQQKASDKRLTMFLIQTGLQMFSVKSCTLPAL